MESTATKMIAQPSNMKNATMWCWRRLARSTSSSSVAGGDAGGGAPAWGTNRGLIVSVIFPLFAAQAN